MANIQSFFKEAYERLLVAATVVMIGIVAACYVWGVGLLLAAVKDATTAPLGSGGGQGFRTEEAELLLQARGILP